MIEKCDLSCRSLNFPDSQSASLLIRGWMNVFHSGHARWTINTWRAVTLRDTVLDCGHFHSMHQRVQRIWYRSFRTEIVLCETFRGCARYEGGTLPFRNCRQAPLKPPEEDIGWILLNLAELSVEGHLRKGKLLRHLSRGLHELTNRYVHCVCMTSNTRGKKTIADAFNELTEKEKLVYHRKAFGIRLDPSDAFLHLAMDVA
uniref:Uncharacterized protein n=1 Tax=Vespula pensylvanica TaxID=30213 RepID=A0A834P3S7_VESPE|nr:hypothetical protein H0235_006931 [Vespula pensylvanica]